MGGQRVAGGHDIGRNVLQHDGAGAGHGVRPDLAELVNLRVATQDDPVTDVDVTCQVGGVGEDGVVAHHAVMRDVDIGHDPVVVTDPGGAAVLHGAPVDGDALADGVAVADLEGGVLAGVLLVLRGGADRAKGIQAVVLAQRGGAFEHHMRPHLAAGADAHARPDDGIGADLDAAVQLGSRVDDGGGMDPGLLHAVRPCWYRPCRPGATRRRRPPG